VAEPTEILDRLAERLHTFVELASKVRSTCDGLEAEAGERGDGARVARCRAVGQSATRLESGSRELLERLSGVRDRPRWRVLAALLLTRKRQHRVAALAREVAASFSELATDG